MRWPRRIPQSVILPLALAGFLALGFWTERAAIFAPLRDAVQIQSVPAALLNHGSLGASLRRLRLVRPIRNFKTVYKPSEFPEPPLDASLFQKKRVVGDTLYAPNPDWWEEGVNRPPLPEPAPRPEHFRPGWPLLAINVDPDDLTGLKWGIFSYFLGRGREWERPARMAYYDADGRCLFASAAGLRLHGGRTREPGNIHSYRLHFREEYGAPEFKRGILFTPSNEPIRRLVVRADWPEHHPFPGLLAFDMIERMGGIVPRIQPVVLVLNGEWQPRMYWLAEHVGGAAWVNRIGHRQFFMHVMKGEPDPVSRPQYGNFHHWVSRSPEPMSLEEAEQKADVHLVSVHALMVAYGGTADHAQGAAVFDPRAPRPRWTWVSWDLDHSFWDVYGDPTQRKAWQKESWERVFVPRHQPEYRKWRLISDARIVLFARLMDESPAYRERFLRFFTDMLNHRLNESFLMARIDHYEQLARNFGRADLSFAEEYRKFIRHRPAVLREGLQKMFGVGPVCRVEVRAPQGLRLLIDGYEATAPYTGFYFEGQSLRVQADAPVHRWRLNGAPAGEDANFDRPVTGDWILEAELRP